MEMLGSITDDGAQFEPGAKRDIESRSVGSGIAEDGDFQSSILLLRCGGTSMRRVFSSKYCSNCFDLAASHAGQIGMPRSCSSVSALHFEHRAISSSVAAAFECIVRGIPVTKGASCRFERSLLLKSQRQG